MSIAEYDYTIIGAGPAGMAAAITARKHGLNVLVLDEQPAVGGQIFRNIEGLEKYRNSEYHKLGEEYLSGSKLVHQFRNSGVVYLNGRSVWQIDGDLGIHHVSTIPTDQKSSVPQFCKTKYLLIAVGAMERPMPLPGWTLPGVMACTAADVLYKSSGMIPQGKVILAGSGPLLLLIACRLLYAGVKISAFLDTTPRGALIQALPHLPKALRAFGYLKKGLEMLWKLRTSGIPIYTGIQEIEALGNSKLEKVRFKKGMKHPEVSADLLLLHNGVVPNVQITRQLACDHSWYDVQRYWEPIVDDWGNTSMERTAVAGDCGRVSGAVVSEISGHLSALDTVRQLGAITLNERDKLSRNLRQSLQSHKSARPFLDKLFQPRQNQIVPNKEDVLVCRCEEVTVREIRETVRLGFQNPDRLKSMIRCGMGPCQARMCGLSVSEIIADEKQISPGEVGYFKIRSPIKPITIGQLAENN
ncbi:MAG: NAD(P)/FAD-dependent oxidoreductase [SAR324 cluster bacterium]|nr:NAD(P)/FAD-dependent oxidoreductase [SAR324 cluster bacterium]